MATTLAVPLRRQRQLRISIWIFLARSAALPAAVVCTVSSRSSTALHSGSLKGWLRVVYTESSSSGERTKSDTAKARREEGAARTPEREQRRLSVRMEEMMMATS